MSSRGRVQPRVIVQIASSRRGVPHARSLRAWVSKAVLLSGYSPQPMAYSLCVRIIGNAESRKLNRQWRDKDKPTNVLSFPDSLPTAYDLQGSRKCWAGRELCPASLQPTALSFGDLAICAPVVAREAREQGKTLSAHWAHMVVHGVLHLLGYDHVKTRDAKQMEAREVAILSHFGYQDPYVF